jgi:hypothetical protein
MKAISLRPFTSLEWVVLAFSAVGIVLGLATIVIVRSVYGAFREDLLAKLNGANSKLLAQMLELEQQVAVLSFLLLFMVALLSFILGFVVWRNARVSGPAS